MNINKIKSLIFTSVLAGLSVQCLAADSEGPSTHAAGGGAGDAKIKESDFSVEQLQAIKRHLERSLASGLQKERLLAEKKALEAKIQELEDDNLRMEHTRLKSLVVEQKKLRVKSLVSKTKALGGRTVELLNVLAKENIADAWTSVDAINHDGKHYTVVTGAVTDFVSRPLISLAAGLWGREAIILNPEGELINEYFANLRQEFEDCFKIRGKKLTIEELLAITINFVRTQVFSGTDDKSVTTEHNARYSPDLNSNRFLVNKEGGFTPLIELETFVTQRQGVCRHHALLLSHFLDKVIKDDGLKTIIALPNGAEIHHMRTAATKRGGPHVWCVLKTPAAGSFSADSLWDFYANIEDAKQRELLGKLYGDKAISDIISRLSISISPA